MMIKHTVAAALSIALLATGATAATVGITEGTRSTVDGTFKIAGPDTSSLPGGAYDLDILGDLSEDVFEIYGRIVDAVDNFAFGFSASSTFNVSWIFGGYTTGEGTNPVTASGFVSEGASEKSATFNLLKQTGIDTFELVDTALFTTDITGGEEVIFSAGAGDYVIQIDGSGPNAPGKGVGLYDLRISEVPLPASAWLLLGGFGLLGAAARRKSS